MYKTIRPIYAGGGCWVRIVLSPMRSQQPPPAYIGRSIPIIGAGKFHLGNAAIIIPQIPSPKMNKIFAYKYIYQFLIKNLVTLASNTGFSREMS